MGERKVLNKYYPPDFDPTKIPKKKRAKNDQVKVRMMLPMSIRCNTCGEYLYRGKKFNSRKETVTGEEYLGIKIFRFYIKCTRCSAELTIKTDPKNSDYQCEFGASRNFEPWRENAKVVEEAKDKREQEEMGDAMKALENRTTDSKVEMDILDALDEIRSLNARQSKMDPLEVLLAKQLEQDADEKRLDEEDEALVQSVFGDNVKRIEEETAKAEQINNSLLERLKEEPILTTKKVKTETTAVPKIGIQPKVGVQTIGTQPKVGVQLKTVPKKDATIQKIGEKKESTGLLSLIGSYADNSSDSDV